MEPVEFDENGAIDNKQLNKAISYASRLLGMREYAVLELQTKLKHKGFSDEIAKHCIDYMLTNNWLSDQRYCEAYIRSKSGRGQGYSKIYYDLQQKIVLPEIINEAFTQANIDWQSICDEVAQKKINSISANSELEKKQKLTRFLMYRGFSVQEAKQTTQQIMVMGEVTGEHDE